MQNKKGKYYTLKTIAAMVIIVYNYCNMFIIFFVYGGVYMIKKISVLSILLLFIISITVSATYIDIKDTEYEQAVNALTLLNIFYGYPDGTFMPGNFVTRAEFAAISVRIAGMNLDAVNATGQTTFPDVPDDHWATGYINIAAENGIILGHDDGTFAPNDRVTNAQALTMIIRVTGLEVPEGEWPSNYISKANELGILFNSFVVPNNPATRGDVALYSYNALKVSLEIQ